jgi:iron complex outermembrane receptor protein
MQNALAFTYTRPSAQHSDVLCQYYKGENVVPNVFLPVFSRKGRAEGMRWVSALLLAGGTSLAWAAPTAEGVPDAPTRTALAAASPLEEVIVHARRREEKIQDVPLAITVETGRQLEEQSAVTFEDAVREAPNVLAFKSARSVSALEVTMRGQTAIPSSIVYDPAVGLYIDGVYVANGQAAMGTILDVDSVEIVRGAQGTLFGRNNTGGSISFNTHRPEFSDYSIRVSASAGNRDLFGDRAIVNLPLSDTLAVRFAYQINEHDGWGSSIATGQTNFMNEHRYQWRASALWKPTDSFDAYFTFERFSANEVGALLHPLAGTVAASIPGDIIPADFYQTDTGKRESDIALTDAYQLTLNQRFSESVAAKLILGYRELHATNDYDADAELVSIADVTLFNTSYQKSAELQLSGTTLAQRLDWVGGLYWFKDDGSAPSTLAPGLSSPLPTFDENAVENKSRAAFLHGEYHLTDAWSVAAGARRTEDRRELDDNAFVQIPTGPTTPPFEQCTIVDESTGAPFGGMGPCPPIHKDVAFGYWSWEGSSRYRFSDDFTGYVRAGRAQRSGGWNIPLNFEQATPFQPEQLTDFEVGLKSTLWGGALTLDTDAFTGNYDNMQRLLALLIGRTPSTIVINAGKARVSGVEVAANAALTRALSLDGTFGWTDARYQQFTDTFGNDAAHNEFYMTPKFTWSLAARYEVPIAFGRAYVRADYSWHDRVQFNVLNDFNNQGPVGLLNARAAVTSASGAFEVALFGTNLTDKRYAYNGGTIVNPVGPPIASWQAAGDRRLYGVEATYQLRITR